jgi:hypothetical protein
MSVLRRRAMRASNPGRGHRVALIGLMWMLTLAVPAGAQETPREAVRALIPGSSPADVEAVATAVVQQIASVPIGSSSGGFTFVRDSRTGMPRLKTETFGPSFAERPITLGKAGAFSFSTVYQRTAFRSFEGLDLRNGDLRGELRVNGLPVAELFTTTLDISAATTSFIGAVALTSNLDVGVSVPFVRLSIAGARTGGERTPMTIRDIQSAGLGDVQIRAKWAPIQTDEGALAVAIDMRLPTADEEKLIGVGHLRPRLLLLGSTTSGPVSPHVNLSYQFGGDGAEVRSVVGGLDELVRADVGKELGYTIGVEVAAHPTITLSADLIGRTLKNTARFDLEERGLGPGQGSPQLQAAFAQASQLGRAGLYTLNARVGTLNRWLLALGAKTAILQRGLVRLDVMASLNDEGLKPGVTTVIGFEYTF